MADTITLEKFLFGNSVSGPQTWTVWYKLYSSPTYILKTTSAVADAAGNLGSPVVINALTPGQMYDVQIVNNCQSPGVVYQQRITLTP